MSLTRGCSNGLRVPATAGMGIRLPATAGMGIRLKAGMGIRLPATAGGHGNRAPGNRI